MHRKHNAFCLINRITPNPALLYAAFCLFNHCCSRSRHGKKMLSAEKRYGRTWPACLSARFSAATFGRTASPLRAFSWSNSG